MRRSRTTPLVLGHRGYRARFPENTLLAFREALRAGADGIECDVQKAADGRYVIIHDPGTGRVTGTPLEVTRTPLEALKELDFGRGERIPLLEEMLQVLPPGAFLDLELKEETLLPEDSGRVADILDACRPRRNIMISSFDASLLIPFRALGFTVGYLVDEETARGGWVRFSKTLLQLKPHFLNLPVDLVDCLGSKKAGFIFRTLRLLGFRLLFWTVNSGARAASLAPYARIIVTDEVAEVVEALRSGTGKTTDS